MRILFFSNAMPSFFSPVRPGPSYVTGGWITGMLSSLCQKSGIEMACCFPVPKNEPFFQTSYQGVGCYGIPMSAAFSLAPDMDVKDAFFALISQYRPDVIHIWGTESASALPLVFAAREAGLSAKTVVHIQGVCAAIAECYEAGLPEQVVNRWTLRDLIRRDNIAAQKRAYLVRSENEARILSLVGNAIGRTDFDREACLKINPALRYFSCNESLRPSFYEHCWKRENARPHSVFFSQGNYPLKGFHVMLNALPKLIARYPDLTLRIAGGDPTRSGEGLKGRLLISAYGAYLKERMKANRLFDRVTFLGTLSENAMLSEYLAAEVFVSASANENSPNSVSEAMLLGVPLVTTDVGGVRSLVDPIHDARMIPFGDADALADAVQAAFDQPERTDFLRGNARAHALLTHDRIKNRETLLSIYETIGN